MARSAKPGIPWSRQAINQVRSHELSERIRRAAFAGRCSSNPRQNPPGMPLARVAKWWALLADVGSAREATRDRAPGGDDYLCADQLSSIAGWTCSAEHRDG